MMIPVAIIGAGPAGIAAAIQLKRCGIEFLLLEKNSAGGLLNEANLVENFPSIPNGVPGKTLTARLQRQLYAAGVNVEKAQVLRLSYHEDSFMIQTETQAITAAKVILACGTLPLTPDPPLNQLQLKKQLFNSVLPLLKTRKKTIAVIGGGDAAFDYALNLAKKNKVLILYRSSKPRCLPILFSRCRRHPDIIIHENCRLTHAQAKEGTAEIMLKTLDQLSGQNNEIVCHLILTAIGRMPALHFLDHDLHTAIAALELQKKIFLAGDVSNGRFRQASIAAADGLRSAMKINAEEIKCK
jgi:thioredoxin reductase (NADPH)